jgi:hypothetical protein
VLMRVGQYRPEAVNRPLLRRAMSEQGVRSCSAAAVEANCQADKQPGAAGEGGILGSAPVVAQPGAPAKAGLALTSSEGRQKDPPETPQA